ncbi:MAG: hypothetical protein LBP29_04705 [Treponema sp.]|nr:hypothetical protein [Treponema sp.]
MGRSVLFVTIVCFCLSCAKETPANPAGKPAVEEDPQQRTAAVIRTGAEPFWFELAAGGPRLIPSPRHAALKPFAPWKFSRYVAAFLADQSRLIAVVNQDGFLVFEFPKEGEIAFYYYSAPEWAGYNVSSVFWFDRRPAALLVRDGIFSDSPHPDPALWYFDGTITKGTEPAAFGVLSPEDGWETKDILWGDDGSWYCHKAGRERESAGGAYLKAADLAGRGETSDAAAFLRAARPAKASLAGGFLADALEAAGALAGKPCAFRTVSPEFKASRVFETGMEDDTGELVDASAYYRSGAALALLPDGRGIFRGESYSGSFALPSLPGGCVYTAVCLAGENNGKCTVIVSWEEQRDWNIGAAGFGMLEIGF